MDREISRLKAALEKESNRVVELLRENCDLKTDRDDAISALKQARNEMDEYKDSLNREFEGARELRESCGARDVETFPAFVERLYSERDVARLALEKAERERDSNKFLLGVYKGGFASGRSERDEARRWARYYQKLAQKWRKAYENVWKNNHVMPFGSIMYGTQKPRQNDE